MAVIEMIMPRMGESIIEASVIRWLKKEGDKIEKDESVLEVATDKVDTEVPATNSGILNKILVKEGDTVKVGHPLALISTDSTESIKIQSEPIGSEYKTVEKATAITAEKIPTQKSSTPQTSFQGRFYSPLVLNIAREENISMVELEAIPGTGKENRVTKYDILNYLSQKTNAPLHAIENQDKPVTPIVESKHSENTSSTQDKTPQAVEKPSISFSGEFEIIEMDRMRKIISQRMLESQRLSATVTSYVESDVTNIVHWRSKIKHEFMRREGEGITYLPVFIEAIAKTLKDFPLLNASVDNDRIILKKDINIGIAVALPDGNLIVPVLKHADRYNITGLTKALNQLIKKAKNNKLTADDLSDGTFSVSNIGSFGNVMGTPILVQPQVGIIALGAIRKKPAVIETEQGDTLGIRHMMFISHSYDHRIVDGALGGSFAKKVSDYLEGFDSDRKL